ncbi:MAG TPA: helix-turn-helix domain-containing protein [Solirubrobacteraceae bacterium]|jgi:DNA-binding HxlR family transcriptional regulator|nr:helix-turn-helix domain-containing protein [Solirubrobacteraceae bacterium]
MPVVSGSQSQPGRSGELAPLRTALRATGDHWTLPVVLALARGPLRLSRLRELLPEVSSGVLDRQLQRMSALGMIARERHRETPPRVELRLTESGLELVPVAVALARWGAVRAPAEDLEPRAGNLAPHAHGRRADLSRGRSSPGASPRAPR